MTGQDDPGRAEYSAQDRAARASSSRSPIFIILGLVAVAIAVAIAIWATRRDEPADTSDVAANNIAAQSGNAAKPETRPVSDAQLAKAFEAAFGEAAQAELTTGDDRRIFRPARLLRLDDKYVLLSEGTNVNDCHVCAGALAIHYLRETDDGFAVIGSWPDLVRGSGWGGPPDWIISDEFSTNPTVFVEGGYTAQGCTSGGVTLTELRPDKPVQSELVRTHFDNQSGFGELNGQSIKGTIGNVRKDTSFEVTYSGARSFTEKWVKKGGVYRLEPRETKMPQC